MCNGISLLFLILGVFLLKYGADFLVNSTTGIAKIFGISDRIIDFHNKIFTV